MMGFSNEIRALVNFFQPNPTLKRLVQKEIKCKRDMERYKDSIYTGLSLLRSDDRQVKSGARCIIDINRSMYQESEIEKHRVRTQRKLEEENSKLEKHQKKQEKLREENEQKNERIRRKEAKERERERERRDCLQSERRDCLQSERRDRSPLGIPAPKHTLPSAPMLPNECEIPSAPPLWEDQNQNEVEIVPHNQCRNKERCAICFDDFDARRCETTRCYHTFHKDCLDRILKVSDNCPLCRCRLWWSSLI